MPGKRKFCTYYKSMKAKRSRNKIAKKKQKADNFDDIEDTPVTSPAIDEIQKLPRLDTVIWRQDNPNVPQSPSHPIPEIKTEIGSDNEEEDQTQYLDNAQSEVALETIKVEYEVDIEDHFNQYVAKKQKISEEVKSIEDKEKYKTMSDLTPNVSQPENVDNYDAFGVYIATLLRALPPKKALAVQPKIVALIVSANIEEHLQS